MSLRDHGQVRGLENHERDPYAFGLLSVCESVGAACISEQATVHFLTKGNNFDKCDI